MNAFENMTAYLMILGHNLKTLHYNVTGQGFYTAHKELQRAYEEVNDMMDDLIEIGIPLGFVQPSIQNAILAYQADILPIMARKSYDSIKLAIDGYNRAVELATLAKAELPVDVQSEIDGYIYNLRKTANYKMKRYINEPTAKPNVIEEDD